MIIAQNYLTTCQPAQDDVRLHNGTAGQMGVHVRPL